MDKSSSAEDAQFRSQTIGLYPFNIRPLPPGLEPLSNLALDLRWTWSHAADLLWRLIDDETWSATENAWLILKGVSQRRLEEIARDPEIIAELHRLDRERADYLQGPGWYGRMGTTPQPRLIAYFSMEFGLGEGLPLYAGGLGVLAGDFLKTASDLAVPVVGVGLLYGEGYFRQVIDASGRQLEFYPKNDPSDLPILPVRAADGSWLTVELDLPGRKVRLRVWRAIVGRAALYLLDSNDPFNSPADRSITAKLYESEPHQRLLQEMALGIGGWRALESLGLRVEVCHLNEGHAALAVVERARSFMSASHCSFKEALCATRIGNIFTTHTPVAAAFDTFPATVLIKQFGDYVNQLGIEVNELLALGRKDRFNSEEPFNMAFLAMRGSGWVNGVSRLHGEVSRRIFQSLFPRWPEREIPVTHVTNGVHAPSWDSQWSDELWTSRCGKKRWLTADDDLGDSISQASDKELWSLRNNGRLALVRYARERLIRQLRQRGADDATIARAENALDPHALTLGFARRFTDYKRPNLILSDPAKLERILRDDANPTQLVVAGKAHPRDTQGKDLLQAILAFAGRSEMREHVVFLEDYDLSLAEILVQGVDVWINTPRRTWEACGTSGMKVLVNGGLNLSELDGWWDEAYSPEVGWALGDSEFHEGDGWDRWEAGELYQILERQIVPEFFQRDNEGLPQAWLARIRASIRQLAPRFSSNRMLREYVQNAYRTAGAGVASRSAADGKLARELCESQEKVARGWSTVRFGALRVEQLGSDYEFAVEVFPGALDPAVLRVELYADPMSGLDPFKQTMEVIEKIASAPAGLIYKARVSRARPSEHYTPRILATHPAAVVPLEESHILWFR